MPFVDSQNALKMGSTVIQVPQSVFLTNSPAERPTPPQVMRFLSLSRQKVRFYKL